MIYRLILLVCSFVTEMTFSNMFEKEEYNYDFDVHPVDSCPMNESEWQAAAERTGCIGNRGYHCVPDKFHKSLIEFCYYRPRILVSKGNCLELAANGILNHAICQNFTWGCPDKPYLSDKIYNYPTCLNIVFGCFTSDITCLRQKVQIEESVISTEKPVKQTCKQCDTCNNLATTVVIIVLAILLAVFVSARLITIIRPKRYGRRDQPINETVQLQDNFDFDSYNRKTLQVSTKYKKQLIQLERYNDNDDDSAFEDELFFGVTSEENDTANETVRKLHDIIFHGEEQHFEIFRMHHGINEYKKKNSRGFNSLHISAKCGNLKIFKEILECHVDIESLTADGRNSLHIAAFYGSVCICKYILENRKDLFDITDRYNMNPAHWAALAGQDGILNIMLIYSCNLSLSTPIYKENIVSFACIGESYNVLKFIGSNEDIAYLLYATNSEGLNSIQYAAKIGNLKVFKFLCDKEVTFHNRSRQTGKNCLHTACEKGNIEICRYILIERNDKTLITQVDKHGQHVGHFAAKSGNIEILQLLIEVLSDTAAPNPALLEQATTDNINILHIACRHAQFDMCIKIADTFPGLISEITERGWNAALFITEKAGAEKERIMILNFLEKLGLDIYHVTRSCKTILYNACVNRSAKLVKYLLNHYPNLLNIEKAMDPRKAAKSQEIQNIFIEHFDMKLLN